MIADISNDHDTMHDNTITMPIRPIKKTHKFFKHKLPTEMIHNFIRKISYKIPNSDNYLIDFNAYKKATYCSDSQTVSLLEQFCNDLMPFYCKEKQIFLTRKMSYNNLNTILRQVCRQCAIQCKSDRKYDKSKTQIVYYIALDNDVNNNNDAIDAIDVNDNNNDN
jgi:hypothetical protein